MLHEAVAPVAPAASEPPGGADEALRREVRELREDHARLWLGTGCALPGDHELGPELSRWRQWGNARRTDRLVRRLCREALRAPEEEGEARRAWEAGLKAEVSSFGEACLGWPASWREAPLAEEIFTASADFVRRARELAERFGVGLSREDLFQALRNVWILNGLQVLLARPVAVTPSVFAYSLLYPLTDNFLDDPEVSPAAKAAFTRRLGRRLAGELPAVGDRREEAVLELIGAIEEEYPRAFHPRVWASLLAIHRGQIRSLGQQAPATAGAPDLLRVSCEKGGTSVLADGFLVAGDLTPEEARFLFGYGVALQLLDDLQDAAEDRAAGHRTLFSVAAGRRPLDDLTSRLARFTRRVLAPAEGFEAPGWEVVAGLIRRNCPLLLLQAVADQRGLFTPGYVRRLERRFPVRFGSLPRLRRRARRRWRRTERVIEQEGRSPGGVSAGASEWLLGRDSNPRPIG